MVDPIGASGPFNQRQMQVSRQPMTADQKAQVQSILAEYDSASLTDEDATAINRAFQDAGIRPSLDLRDTIEAAGFDPTRLRDAPGAQHPGGTASASGGMAVDMNALKSLQSILDDYDLSELTSNEQSSLVERLSQSGLLRTGLMLDVTG